MAVAMIVGVGPGLGAAVAERFAREGFALGLMARRSEVLETVRAKVEAAGATRALGVAGDASSVEDVRGAVARIEAELGPPEVLVYNAGAFMRGGVLELTPEVFETSWRVGCMGAFLCAQAVAPGMVQRGSGTLIFTGATASLRGGAGFSALAVPKFGLRALAQSLARELGPRGVHVAHVIIDGMIDLAATRAWFPDRGAEMFLAPSAIAETYWQLHAQDRTAWTQELDLRPAVEKF
jgi:NAD(P)-dependent dehydrogenase (short-subunit alcohol dehydrogenase family)